MRRYTTIPPRCKANLYKSRSAAVRTPRHPTRGLACPSETKRLGDSDFVLASFLRHGNVVGYRRACVDEEQGTTGAKTTRDSAS